MIERSNFYQTAGKSYRPNNYGFKKKCLNCNTELKPSSDHLYYVGFCTQKCKDEYFTPGY